MRAFKLLYIFLILIITAQVYSYHEPILIEDEIKIECNLEENLTIKDAIISEEFEAIFVYQNILLDFPSYSKGLKVNLENFNKKSRQKENLRFISKNKHKTTGYVC